MPAQHVLGVDLGGTKCIVARFDAASMNMQEKVLFPTRASEGFLAVLEDVIVAIKKLQTPETTAVGMGVPGLVQQPEGVLLHAPNIATSTGIPLKQKLEEALKLPVFLSNDANCFTLAEASLGAGMGNRVVVGITFGTGVGGGIVMDGKLFRGAHGFAAEIGHMLLQPGKPPYETDDKRGDVEQFLAGTAMGLRCKDASSPADYLSGATCAFMQPDIFREIAWLCTSLSHLIDPDMIVFGGSAGRALKPHLPAIKKELAHWMLPHTPLPKLAISSLENAGTLGAALLTKQSS